MCRGVRYQAVMLTALGTLDNHVLLLRLKENYNECAHIHTKSKFPIHSIANCVLSVPYFCSSLITSLYGIFIQQFMN